MRTRIVTLICGYRDDPHELIRVARQGLELGPAMILVDDGDYDREILSLVSSEPGLHLTHGNFARERTKRNALLGSADLAFSIRRDDWILTLDPDEKLLNGDMLPMLLDRVPHTLPAFPLPRNEPDGRLMAMPSKMIRGSAAQYVHLDVFIDFTGSGVWNLDPFEIPGSPRPGAPLVAHFGSPRADRPTDSFYSEPNKAPTAEHNFEEVFNGNAAWAFARSLAGAD